MNYSGLCRRFVSVLLTAVLFLACQSTFAQWNPPVGIPMPDFGITNSHWMYTNANMTFNFGSGAVPYPKTTNGPYTHYVNVSASNATDTSNPFGTPSLPRRTIPVNLPPGSVVEVHGGPYTDATFNGRTMIGLTATGSISKPVFIRGVSPTEAPVMARQAGVYGSCLIIENLKFITNNIVIRSDLMPAGIPCDRLAIRHLTMTGNGAAAGSSAAIGGIGSWNTTNKPPVTRVVVWDNDISYYGDCRQSVAENDFQGVEVDGYCTSDIWILENDIHHMGGDSVRVGSNPTSYPFNAVRVYVGRNTLHENRENGLDIKGIHDVVVSENEMYGFAPSSTDAGSAIPIHYMCGNIWIVNNTIHDAPFGVSCTDVEDIYFVGNQVYNVGRAVEFWNQQELHIIANTFAQFKDRAVSDVGGGSLPHPLINNVFFGMQDSSGYQVVYSSGVASASAMSNNLFFDNSSPMRVRWGGGTFSTVSSLQTGTGKGSGCLWADPKFSSAASADFRITADSPAKGAGATMSTYNQIFASKFPGQTIAIDIAGVSRPSIPAIGAFEPGATTRPIGPSNLRIVSPAQ